MRIVVTTAYPNKANIHPIIRKIDKTSNAPFSITVEKEKIPPQTTEAANNIAESMHQSFNNARNSYFNSFFNI
jgi:hypothetical protein